MSGSMGDPAYAPPFIRAWDDYTAACQALFERLSDPSAIAGTAVPPAFLSYWQQFAKNLGMPSGAPTAGQFNPEELFKGLLPGLGITREHQEIAQRMLDLSVQFHRRYAEFVQQSADIGQRALQSIQKRTAGDANLASSPKALYDAWIDSAEEAYAQAAHGESFAKLLAELCNVLSAFKVERGKLLEAYARQLDLPTRAEVDSLHRQVRDLTNAARKTSTRPPPQAKPKASKPGQPRKSLKPGKRVDR
jgi:class III poly(R)-hydroxyalkanoic acid synthase PhaE subunit